MQIKTCQDCDQLRPFTVKRTCPAKNRANSDIIESFFQEDPCMDLASRLIWRCFLETPSNESARKSKFCQIIWVTFITLWFHEFFQLLLILSSSKILCRFFCQNIMGNRSKVIHEEEFYSILRFHQTSVKCLEIKL